MNRIAVAKELVKLAKELTAMEGTKEVLMRDYGVSPDIAEKLAKAEEEEGRKRELAINYILDNLREQIKTVKRFERAQKFLKKPKR